MGVKPLAGYVIIGNSAAAVSAAEAIRKVRPAADITMIAEEATPPYSRCLLPEVVAGDMEPSEIRFRPAGFYRDLGIEPLLGERAESLDPQAKVVRLASGREVAYSALLVATGARPVSLGIPGEDLAGVFGLRELGDAQEIARRAEEARAAVVVGGGLVGLKVAAALKKRGLPQVSVVVKSGWVLSRQLDRQAAELVQNALEGRGIRFVFGQNPKALLAKPGTREVGSVLLEDGSALPADLVVVAKGVTPRGELVREAGGQVAKGVVVDAYLRTTLPDIYAAGDVTEVVDLVIGEAVPSGLWTLAVEQGRAAGLNMAGEKCPYPGGLTRLNVAEFAGVAFVSAGLVDYPGPNIRVLKRLDPERRVYRRLVFRDQRLVGAVLVGDISRAGAYVSLIRRQTKVGGFEEDLVRGEVSGAVLGSLLPENLKWEVRVR
jgi:NAD(P)H-nitrite reductase large subunit